MNICSNRFIGGGAVQFAITSILVTSAIVAEAKSLSSDTPHSKLTSSSSTMTTSSIMHPLLTLSLGPAWSRGGETQTFELVPGISKTYSAQKGNRGLANAEIFIGAERALNQRLSGQLGLELAATTDARLSGNIWEDANPAFNNYTYQYKIQHQRLALKGKLLSDFGYAVPYVGASIGLGWNKAHAFTIQPILFEEVAAPPFNTNTTTALSYTLSLGVEKAMNTRWRVGLGYEFANWGKSQLERANGQTLNNGITLNHLYTNGVLLNLTYVA